MKLPWHGFYNCCNNVQIRSYSNFWMKIKQGNDMCMYREWYSRRKNFLFKDTHRKTTASGRIQMHANNMNTKVFI